MSESFQNPAIQGQMDKLEADLQRLSSEVNQLNTGIARESTQRRSGGQVNTGPEVVQYLEREQVAINQQVVSYERLNALISQRIALEAEAAAATQRTTAAVSRAVIAPSAGTPRTVAASASSSAAQLEFLAATSSGFTPQSRAALSTLEGRGPLLLPAAAPGPWQGPARYPAAGLGQVTTTPDAKGTVAATRQAEAAAQAEARQMQALAATQATATARADEMATATRAQSQALIEATQVAIQYDDTLTKTGALSGAAIEALARGNITFSEVQRQVTETVSKFGLWTAAAGAVYGVLGAVMELKTGLVDTGSAVQGLTKYLPNLNRGSARDQIVSQAQQTATPIGDVGDTAQQFAKVFKSQSDVFTATHVALTAAKLDNISLAQSYQYLTAIIEQTGQSASYLPTVFDQITAAQDRFGARMSQLLPAFAGSVGSVQQAGGDPNQLLGLEALTIERTGRTGAQIATAFARGASNFFPTSQSQGTIQRILGGTVDPNAGFTKSLIEAIRGADSQGINGPEQRQLSQAFFGKSFGSRFATLFSGAATGPHSLDTALSVTAPGASTGLATEQLSKTLNQPNNQLELLKVNLQAIGAELGNSSITTPLGLMVHLLNSALGAAVDLQKAFGALPGPLKEAASFAVIGAGGLVAARRFGLGSLLASSDSRALNTIAPIFSRSPEDQLNRQTSEIMRRIQSDNQGQLASVSNRVRAQTAEFAFLQSQGGEPSDTQKANRLSDQQRLKYLSQANSPEALAAQELQVRGMLGPGLGVKTSAVDRGASLATENLARTMTASAAEIEAAATQTAESLSAVAVESRVAAASQGESALASIGLAAGAATGALLGLLPTVLLLGTALLGTVDAIHKTDSRAQSDENKINSATTPSQIRAALHDIQSGAGGISPFGLHIPLISNELGKFHERINGSDSVALQSAINRYNYIERADASNSTIQGRVRNLLSPGPADGIGTLFPGQQPTVTAGAINQAIDALKQDKTWATLNPGAYNAQVTQLQSQLQGQSLTQGKTNPFYMWQQASSDLTNKYEPLMEDYASAGRVLGTGPNSKFTTEQIAGYAEAISRFANNTSDKQAWQTLSSAQSSLESDLQRQIQDIVGAAQVAPNLNAQIADYAQAIETIHGEMQKTRELFQNRIKANPGRAADLRKAEKQVLGHEGRSLSTPMSDYISGLTTQAQESASQNTSTGPLADMQRAQVLLAGLQETLVKARAQNADGSDIAQLSTQINQQELTVHQAQISYYQGLYQAYSQYAQSLTADPVAQQQAAAQWAQNTLDKLRQLGDKDRAALIALGASRNSARLQELASQISQEQASAQAGLSQENIGKPQQTQLQNAVDSASEQLNYVLAAAKTGSISPQTITQAYNTLYQAQGALAQFEIQNAQSLITASGQLAQAQTFDPIKMAADALAASRRLLAFDKAHHMSSATLTSDAATVASNYKSQMEATWARSQATTQFLASTYQITGAQEIMRLQNLLTTLKKSHASYQEIQSVTQELYNLEYNNSGSFNLNTAQIHLPSTYEVKSAMAKNLKEGARNIAKGMTEAALEQIKDVIMPSAATVKHAAKGGTAAQRTAATRTALAGAKIVVENNIVVNRNADVRKVFKALDDALNNSVSGVAQAAGLV